MILTIDNQSYLSGFRIKTVNYFRLVRKVITILDLDQLQEW